MKNKKKWKISNAQLIGLVFLPDPAIGCRAVAK
jgi:hypothetical protein